MTPTIKIDESRHDVFVGNRQVTLARSEYNTLLALAKARGKVLSRAEILRSLGGNEYSEGRAIDQYVTRLRRKLRLPEAIRTVMGTGYALDGAEFINEPKVYAAVQSVDLSKCTAVIRFDYDSRHLVRAGGAVKLAA